MSDLNAGTVVAGRYRIISMVGSGGMANVYKAHDSTSHRNVALKVLKSEFATDAEFVRRFRSEAQAVLNLSHDNIVRSYDVGQWEEYYYIVLEYVSGKTLKEIITEEAPFERKRIISMGCQLCDALGHAHERNVVHRDVKPQNVIINDHGRPKVADFGIARFTDASTVTYTGDKILGSVHYVSPEQAKGELVDAKSDIYSLGIVLYEMATGRVPFDAENTVSVAIKHLQEEMVPPIVHNPKIGVALNGIILRATSKEKAARYASMRELKRDLLRAVREPDADFAGREAKLRSKAASAKTPLDGGQKKQQSSPFKRTMMLGIIMLITVGILLSFLLIGSALLNKNSGEKQIRYVPSLSGKTLAAAFESAKSMGFVLVVRSRVIRDDVPADTVIVQEPKAGNQGREGDTIYVDVSAGPATVEAPILTGLTVEEATIAAEEWGLSIAGVTYEDDRTVEPGKVIRQSPEEGTEMYIGDEIYIVVSGSEEDMAIMPALLGDKLTAAIERLRSSGFSRIFVRTVESAELPGRVVNQLPEGNTLQAADTQIELWASPELDEGEYSADRAFNLEIPANDSKVAALRYSDGVYYVLYENTLPAGQQTVSLTVRGSTEGPYEIIITVNGEEACRESVPLAKRKQ